MGDDGHGPEHVGAVKVNGDAIGGSQFGNLAHVVFGQCESLPRVGSCSPSGPDCPSAARLRVGEPMRLQPGNNLIFSKFNGWRFRTRCDYGLGKLGNPSADRTALRLPFSPSTEWLTSLFVTAEPLLELIILGHPALVVHRGQR